MNWPLRGPDLTPIDFILWWGEGGCIKSRVYTSNPESLVKLKENIHQETFFWDTFHFLIFFYIFPSASSTT